MSDPVPYREWPADPLDRWIYAGHTFGRHLMRSARDYAYQRIPADASEETQAVAKDAAFYALYGVMMLLDGITKNEIDPDHRATYVLSLQVRDTTGAVVKTVELAPDGDGLCMGIHAWMADEFEPPPW